MYFLSNGKNSDMEKNKQGAELKQMVSHGTGKRLCCKLEEAEQRY